MFMQDGVIEDKKYLGESPRWLDLKLASPSLKYPIKHNIDKSWLQRTMAQYHITTSFRTIIMVYI